MTNFLSDTYRFLLSYRLIADLSPLQLYSSALIFAPNQSIIRNTFQTFIPSWISQQPEVESGWNAVQQTLEGHSHVVTSVAFSHDSNLLASASSDKTVKIWDASTGALQQTLEGHSNQVTSVAFSHDSKLLVSASRDHTVRIWDTSTGSCHQTVAINTLTTSLSFNSIDSNILTNGGSIKVDMTRLLSRSEYPQEGRDKGGHQRLGISGSWVTWNTQNLLWLPPDHRATEFDISPSGSIVAGGCLTGKVFIIRFLLANLM